MEIVFSNKIYIIFLFLSLCVFISIQNIGRSICQESIFVCRGHSFSKSWNPNFYFLREGVRTNLGKLFYLQVVLIAWSDLRNIVMSWCRTFSCGNIIFHSQKICSDSMWTDILSFLIVYVKMHVYSFSHLFL